MPSLSKIRETVTKCFTQGQQKQTSLYPTIDLFFWRPKEGVNFGDELSRTITELMLADRGFTLSDQVSCARQLLAIGSVLHFAEDQAVVWGSGRNGKVPDDAHAFAALDVRAVRGPRTQEFLKKRGINAPDVYGDPALLLPVLTKGRFKPSRQKKILFVPNLNDYKEHPNGLDFSAHGVDTLSPKQGWNKAVEEIVQYEFVAASSLHGLIIAEAFGIPARYVRLTEQENLFKYHDYYEGTGRSLTDIAPSVPEAIEMGGMMPPVFNAKKLMDSFPYDLWER